MHPLVCLRIPSTAGRNDRQMRVVLAMTPMGLDHDDIAALKGLATHRTKEIVQAFHPTLHERMVSYFNCTTGKVSHSVKDHTWSARPAAIAGVRFCHPPSV